MNRRSFLRLFGLGAAVAPAAVKAVADKLSEERAIKFRSEPIAYTQTVVEDGKVVAINVVGVGNGHTSPPKGIEDWWGKHLERPLREGDVVYMEAAETIKAGSPVGFDENLKAAVNWFKVPAGHGLADENAFPGAIVRVKVTKIAKVGEAIGHPGCEP